MQSRRTFVQTATFGASALFSSPAASQPSLFDKPMRWAQLAFVEDDPQSYDPKFWLDYFQRVHADALCLSAGGCVAFYPTKIPLHYRSKFLGSSDPFGEIFTGARKQGMIVAARTDPHAVHNDVYEAHPDWIAVDAEGKKRRHWAHPGYWVTCALGPYNFDFMTRVTREIVERYDVAGVFSNRWAGSGMCYCEHCRKNFTASTGLELPRTTDPHNPARQAYLTWHDARLFELWRLWDTEVRKIRPAARFIANSGGGALSNLNMKTCGEMSDFLAADRQARRGLMPPWAAGKNGKEYRAAMGSKPVAALFSVGIEEPYRWKDSVQNGAELRIWSADGTANGMRPWFVKFAATLRDRRWLDPVAEIFDWHYRHERYLRNTRPLARAAIVYSQQTARYYGGDQAHAKVEDHELGYYQALIEARIPFEMVHDQLLDPAHIDQFKVLILPNIAALSDAQCQQLTAYVERGGSLIATFETSLYNETGVRRKDFGLTNLYGCSFTGAVDQRMQNSYLRLDRHEHPLLKGLEQADRIINGVKRVDVESTRPYPNPPITLIPSYPDLPMEEVYPRQAKTDIPQVYAREHGKGRVVYFPWDIDRTFWEVLAVDHGKLLANAVDWAANEPRPLEVKGPGLLDVTYWEQPDSLTVHLVNLTNPMAMKGPYRELIPVSAQTVTLRLGPRESRIKSIKLLRGSEQPQVRRTEGTLEVTVPSVLDHEVIAIDL